jgi:hypothetical protein
MASACARAVTPAFCCQHCAIRRPTSPGSPATSARSVGPARSENTPARRRAPLPRALPTCPVRRPPGTVAAGLASRDDPNDRLRPREKHATRPTLKTIALGTIAPAPPPESRKSNHRDRQGVRHGELHATHPARPVATVSSPGAPAQRSGAQRQARRANPRRDTRREPRRPRLPQPRRTASRPRPADAAIMRTESCPAASQMCQVP